MAAEWKSLVVPVAVLVGCAVGAVVVVNYHARREGALPVVKEEEKMVAMTAPAVVVETPAPVKVAAPVAVPVVVAPPAAVQAAPVKVAAPVAAVVPQQPQVPDAGGRSVPEPVAREALALVGTDAMAEQVWTMAINDENLSPDERKNLIEDLNEDGFPDPKNLTQDDLPLIESRIALIEQMGPDAMDDVNGAAFDEAYKDLLEMRAKVKGQ